jgi:hypothetical protein
VNDKLPKSDTKEMALLVDSTTINTNQFKWAKSRKNKGELKLHTAYDPMVEVLVYFKITNAKVNDRKALDSTPIESGIIYVIDRTYNDYQWYYNLTDLRKVTIYREEDKKRWHLSRMVLFKAQLKFQNFISNAGRLNYHLNG